ncbi:YidC/Oxa1 family membrane protein insertase [Verrucomicrobium sp. GAS474]|uniref:membrane protein insertase YidC n=1 Tax=Verrucomicrobium sp. GAS474 TaxID=1882831 RepID=UPI00087DB15B|nr:membrane protein insertase YidC [Verrucomicrobium sp. GAS474]SDU01463.1 YidC/Oxa1 family membrane protein insertase [Verrucomicrobium sp. GAS474]
MNEPSPRLGKSDWLAVGLCVAALVGWTFYSTARWPSPKTPPRPNPADVAKIATPATAAEPASTPTLSALPGEKEKAKAKPAPAPAVSFPEARPVLENSAIRVTFTSHGGGPATIVLKQHAEIKGGDPVLLNGPGLAAVDHVALPIFNLTGWNTAETESAIDYQLEPGADETHVAFARTLPNGLRIERLYTLDGSYGVKLEERLTNTTGQALSLPERQAQIGLVGPLYHNDGPPTIGATWSQAGSNKATGHITAPEFEASGSFNFISPHPARDGIAGPEEKIGWAAVRNRFFTVVLTAPEGDPIRRVTSLIYRPGHPQAPSPAGTILPAVSASATFAPFTLNPNETRTEDYSLYAGPKEYDELATLGQGQKALMDFGFFAWAALPLLKAMKWIHTVIPSYGWSIILLTACLKGIFWPLQSKANHSMKLMQAVAPKQKEISAKYKDDPAKMQQEVMKLYREYGVNPLGGCLPMLIQIPIFIGFYTMLQSAVEFRHETWFWIKDLVQPDTIAVLPGVNLPINPLPIIMTLSQWALMRITPQTGDAAQMKILQFMPFIMLIFFYNFASALALYWTVNNFISMFQTYRNLKKPLPVLQRVKKAAPGNGISFKR